MKRLKPIIKITAFSLIFSVVLYALSYMAKPAGYNLRHIEGIYAEEDNSLDVVYIGGSAAFVYYAPLKAWNDYGIVSYDYAADTIQPELYKTMIKEILKTQTPKLIVVDARSFQYRDKDNIDAQPPGEVPYRNTLTGMRLSQNKVDFINKYVEKQTGDEKLSYCFDIIKYHDIIVCFNGNNIKMMFGKYKEPFNGFYFVPKVEEIENYDFSTTDKKAVSSDTEEILNDLLDYMDGTGIDYLFTVSPYAEKKEHKMIFNYVQEKVENRGYKFIDCNEYTDIMKMDFDRDFYNENHVNIFGAEKYTDFLSEYIITNYAVPNRKDDSKYAFMNTYLVDWNHEVEDTKTAINKLIEENSNE
ncbi:MAG: hypothetical protein PUC88_05965 [Clostridia bacterium]|nr:hypothetical protein [Clostridia bacterium]